MKEEKIDILINLNLGKRIYLLYNGFNKKIY